MKRGQSSLEFMMTYGWVIVVATVVLVVTYEWGLLTPSANPKQTYLGFWGITPVDCSFRENGDLVISFQNDISNGDVNITRLTIDNGFSNYSVPLNERLTEGERVKVILASGTSGLSGMAAGDRYDLMVSVEYVDNKIGPAEIFRSSGRIGGVFEEEAEDMATTTSTTMSAAASSSSTSSSSSTTSTTMDSGPTVTLTKPSFGGVL